MSGWAANLNGVKKMSSKDDVANISFLTSEGLGKAYRSALNYMQIVDVESFFETKTLKIRRKRYE